MKKNIKNISVVIIIIGAMLLGLTGCTSKVTIETDGENDIQINTNVISKNEKEESNSTKDNNQNKEANNTTTQNNSKIQLNSNELTEIQNFLNSKDNNIGFLCINYSSPEDLVKQIANTNIGHYLDVSAIGNIRYTIAASNYSTEPNENQRKYLKGEEGANLITEQNLIKLFKEKFNYQYRNDEIRKDLNQYYNEKLGMYEFYVSDTNAEMKFEVKNGYKQNGKYYLNVEFKDYKGEIKTIELVLEKNDDTYTFYSCKNSAINEKQ